MDSGADKLTLNKPCLVPEVDVNQNPAKVLQMDIEDQIYKRGELTYTNLVIMSKTTFNLEIKGFVVYILLDENRLSTNFLTLSLGVVTRFKHF